MLDNNDSIFLVHNGKNITCKEFKQTVKKQITYIKTLTPAEVVLSGDDTYTLLVNLFSCIYLKIPTVLIGDKTRLQYVDGIYIDKVVNSTEESEIGGLDLEYTISFLTSGSTGAPKKINISLRNLIAEGTTDFSGVYFRATDMDLTSGFAPIGTGELPFNGIFEGPSDADRAEIKITVNETDQEYVGLFGGLGEGAIVRYINVSGIVKNETSEGRAGMIAGILGNGALIEYCSAEGSVEATTSKGMAGGIVGKVNAGGTIRNSTNNATVTGSMYAGGIAGAINGDSKEEGQVAGIPIIDGCHNDGAVSSTGSGTVMAGGIVGEARNATISNCYTTESSSVSGSYQVGGIAGQTTGGATIENSENRRKMNHRTRQQIV